MSPRPSPPIDGSLPSMPSMPSIAAATWAWPPAPRAAPAADDDPGLFGQERVIERLDAAIARARSGAGAAILLRGGGEGTAAALARRAIERVAASDPHAVILHVAAIAGCSAPFQVFASLVEGVAAHLAGLAPAARQAALAGATSLLRISPSLRRLAAASQGAALPERTAACWQRAVAELRAILDHLAGRGSLVLVIEDVHECDRDSADCIDAILDAGALAGALILATIRVDAEDLAALPRALASFESIATVTLPGEAARAYARRRLRAHQSPRLGLASVIAAASEGQPLVIDALARLVAPVRASRPEARPAPPAAIDRLLASVLVTLRARDRQVVELIALHAAPVTADLLAEALGCPVDAAIERLADGGFLERGRHHPASVATTPRIGEAIVRLIPGARRLALGRDLADAHRRSPRGDLARAAHFYLGADAWSEASEAARAAAEEATRAGAEGLAAELGALVVLTDPRARRLRLRLTEIPSAEPSTGAHHRR